MVSFLPTRKERQIMLASIQWHPWERTEGVATDTIRESGNYSLQRYTVPGMPPITKTETLYFLAKVESGEAFASMGIADEHTMVTLWGLLVDDELID